MAMFVQAKIFLTSGYPALPAKKKDEFTAFTGITKTLCHKKKKEKKKKKKKYSNLQMLEFVKSNAMKILTGYLKKKIFLFIFAKSPSIA